MYIMFHHLKGTPYVTGDQGDARRLTNWEQIDNGEQYTATRKFLIAVPIVLCVWTYQWAWSPPYLPPPPCRFVLASFYTAYDPRHSTVNILALLVGVVPKLPQFHKFRLFGFNKY